MTEKNYVVTSTLPLIFGGRTKALLERTRNLEDELNEQFTIVTTNYHPNYYLIYEDYIRKGYVNSQTKFINIYDYIANRDYNYKKKIVHDSKIKGYQIQEVKKDTIYRYFVNGEYERYRKYDSRTGVLLFEDIMDPYSRKRKERIEYNNFGYCFRKIVYKTGTTNRVTELYYDDKGKVYLEKWFKGKDETLSRILLFGDEIIEFETDKDFFEYMFNQILEENSITFCDARLLDDPLLKCNVKTKRIFILHSSHKVDGELRKSYNYLFNHSDKADKIIVLTEEQAEEIADLGVLSDKIEVIPHSISKSKTNKEIKRTNYNKEILFVGRLEQEKQIDHIIQAFSQFNKKYQDWTLSIYGEGSLEEELQELINKHELNKEVHLNGYANNVEELYGQAAFSVITSKFEGFGLVIMESINEGCPVLAYNLQYGPKDIIVQNENGLIIERDNIEALAIGMEKMVLNPLDNVCLDKRFYKDQTIKKWKQIIKS